MVGEIGNREGREGSIDRFFRVFGIIHEKLKAFFSVFFNDRKEERRKRENEKREAEYHEARMKQFK